PVRRKRDLKRGGHVRFRLRSKKRKRPAFVLQPAREGDIGFQQPVGLHTEIVLVSALQEVPINLNMAKSNLNSISRARPVRPPGLPSMSVAADPVSQDVAVARVAVFVAAVRIHKPWSEVIVVVFRVDSLYLEIEFGNLRNAREVQTRVYRWPFRSDRRK